MILVRSDTDTEGMAAAKRARFRGMSEALMTSMVGFMVGTLFLSLAYSEMLYVLAALSVGLAKVVRLPDAVATRARVGGIRSNVPSTAWNLNSSRS